MPETPCYHCGLPVPPDGGFPVVIQDETHDMCCPGCQAVASAIVDGGLDAFYAYRSNAAVRPEERQQVLEHYDLPGVQEDFVHRGDDGSAAVDLIIGGITCSACAWLIEHHLADILGVVSVTVNVSSHRCRLVWRPETVKLSAILRAFEDIGYRARPAGDEDAERERHKENRTFLLRMGVAGISMMQAGTVAIGLYADSFTGIEPEWALLLRWVSLLLTVPVVFYSAIPFYSAAWRSLKMGHLVMDTSVSLAIILAFAASVWATVTNTGEVYYESVSMFAFLLLLARYLEMRVRHRNERHTASLSQVIPPVAVRITDAGEETVPVKALRSGDLVLVGTGETLPCDGTVARGASEVVEAILTGEQRPVAKMTGDTVNAGTVNLENPLEIRVSATGGRTRLAAILNLVGEAAAVKPRRAAIADRISGWFVGMVLVTSAATALIWYFIDPSRAFWVSLSVLVVTCPCALSMATPTALAATTAELRKKGFLIRKPHVLETLAQIDHAVFDKTGTLTQGRMRLLSVVSVADVDEAQVLRLAAALERGSSHPIACAFAGVEGPLPGVDGQRVVIGQGVVGNVAGDLYSLGKPALARELFGIATPQQPQPNGQWLLLAARYGALAWIELGDELRPDAAQAMRHLEARGVDVELLSGDREAVAEAVALELGIPRWRGGAEPEDKLARVRELQDQGRRVLMVGDGINDVPVLSGADVSVAMGEAADITRLHADSLLISGNLEVLPQALSQARKTERIVRQNLAWSLAYNLSSVPLAAMGYIPPWLAAVGMSVSSLIVVVNSLRLSSIPKHDYQRDQGRAS
ncbi:MAG: heavy metal translocating P-type ATPase [Porticoccaceae bacterium]